MDWSFANPTNSQPDTRASSEWSCRQQFSLWRKAKDVAPTGSRLYRGLAARFALRSSNLLSSPRGFRRGIGARTSGRFNVPLSRTTTATTWTWECARLGRSIARNSAASDYSDTFASSGIPATETVALLGLRH